MQLSVLETIFISQFNGKNQIMGLTSKNFFTRKLNFTFSGAVSQQFWKPQVTPVGEMPTKPTQPGQVFTKTSLAAPKHQVR